MTALATAVFAALFIVAATIGVAIALVRLTRHLRDRRRARLAVRPRRLLLAVAGDGDGDGDAYAALVNLPTREWRAVEPTAFDLLAKVRGEAHAALAGVFVSRGLIDQAYRDLRRPRVLRRARAAAVLGSLHHLPAVPELCRLLDDPHPDVRIAAIQALGRLGDPAAAEPLLASLESAPPAPTQLVAHSLIQLGPPAVPALLAALRRPSPLVRITALDVLRLLGAAEAEEPVAEVLAGDPAPEVRQRAAAALGRIGTRQAVGPLLTACQPGQPAELRAAAARALGELGATAAVPPLRALLSGGDFRTARTAAEALRRLGTDGTRTLAEAATGDDRAAPHAREALALAALERQRAQHVPDYRPAGAGVGG